MRFALTLSSLLLLAACDNQVVSESPWFTKAAEAGAPRLRSGLWITTYPSQKKCRFDERRPSEAWPDCAGVFVVRDDEVLTLRRVDTDGNSKTRTYDWTRAIHILAAGDPRIDQFAGCGEGSDESADGPAGPNASPEADRYCYDAVRPTRIDNGEIVAVESWPILCGPWPINAQDGSQDADAVTTQPFPGLQMVDRDCTADSESDLRAAARASEAIAIAMPFGAARAHWVRNGYH
jgi:hypothetical protein